MPNLLSKRATISSVYVPPVYRTVTRPVVTSVTTHTGGSSWLTSKSLADRPPTMSLMSTATGWVLVNNRRTVGNTEEVWEVIIHPPTNTPIGYLVKITRLVPTAVNVVQYVTETTMISAGYWQSIADPDGWDAAAHSASAILGPVSASFIVPARPAAVLAGLALANRAATQADVRGRIVHGFLVQGDVISVWNSPLAGTGVGGTMEELSPMPPWGAGRRLEVLTSGSSVTWLVDGLAVARAPSAVGRQYVRLAAALYGNNDSIDSPQFAAAENWGSGGVAFTPVVRSGWPDGGRILLTLTARSWNHTSSAVLPALYARGGNTASRGSVLLPAPYVTGYGLNGTTGEGSVLLPAITAMGASYGEGTGAGIVQYHVVASGTGSSPVDEVGSSVLTRDLWEVDMLPGKGMFSGAEITTTMSGVLRRGVRVTERLTPRARLVGTRRTERPLRSVIAASTRMGVDAVIDALVVEVVEGSTTHTCALLLTASIGEVLEITALLEGGRVKDVTLAEALAAHFGVSTESVLEAAIHTVVGHVFAPGEAAVDKVWSVRPDTQGSTSYETYPFTSFANIGGRYYGAAPDGLYELEGATDAGAPIQAVVNMGLRDFGSRALKYLKNAYIVTDAATPMELTVRVGDNAYTYPARRGDAEMRTQRFDLGRGLRAHFFELELRNTDGSGFETDGLQFVVTESNRRI